MRFLLLSAALFAVGCAHLPTSTAVSARAIGCLPGECPPHPQPTQPAPVCAPRTVQAIGCLPGDCPPHPACR